MELSDILESVVSRNSAVSAAAVLDTDGLAVGFAGEGSVDSDLVSAIAASLVLSGEQLTDAFDQGDLQTTCLQGSQGTTVLARCGEGLVLAVLASPKARLGLLLLDVRKAAVKLREVFE